MVFDDDIKSHYSDSSMNYSTTARSQLVISSSRTSQVNMSAKKLLVAALSSVALAVPFENVVEERQAACASVWYESAHFF